ncbi:MAG: ATP-binding protein [Candidatus Omnitrophota bacterium]
MSSDHPLKFSKPLKILVVEDNQVDIRVIEAMLTEVEHYTELMKTTNTLKGALEFLEEDSFDVVILDLNLPDHQGTKTIKRLNELYPQMAIVINTGAYEEELGIQALDYGAQDFLVKGKYNGYTLIKVLHYAIKRKELETELLEAYKKLKVAQGHLVQAEKMKVVGALASGVAHEVRNPLAAIKYGVQYLTEQIDANDEKVQIVLNNINDAVDRANAIITDLLEYSGLSELKKDNCSLNDSVFKALALVNHEIEKKEIKVIKKLDNKLPDLRIDHIRIEQVIINLLLNAVFSVEQFGELKIETFQEDHSICMLVKDNGHGIKEADLDKIFDPFFTTRRAKGGVGLGLSVCRNIMDIHDGDIVINNHPEGGAVAKLIFPITEPS